MFNHSFYQNLLSGYLEIPFISSYIFNLYVSACRVEKRKAICTETARFHFKIFRK